MYKNCKDYDDLYTYNYKFQDSQSYNVKRFSFAWGFWHDSDAKKDGCTYDKNKAILGYERFLQLAPENMEDSNWYYVQGNPIFNSIAYTVKVGNKSIKHVKMVSAAKLRLKALK